MFTAGLMSSVVVSGEVFRYSPFNHKPMKKITCLRNWWLPVLGAWAVLFAGSCSKDEAVEPELSPGTRAVPVCWIDCYPDGKGDGNTYLEMGKTYRFSGHADVSGETRPGMPRCDLTIHASDGADHGIDIRTDIRDTSSDVNMYVRFTAPGYYHVTVRTVWAGAHYEQSKTFCVVSRATKMNLPEQVLLRVPFDFSFTFADPRYPDPTLNVHDRLFDDPRFTILDQDGQGHYRMRIDQPGRYVIAPGLGGIYTAQCNINVYFRPPMVVQNSTPFETAGNVNYKNEIRLCNSSGLAYPVLPYRVFFEYTLNQPNGVSEKREIRVEAGASGTIPMPVTEQRIQGVVYNWRPPGLWLNYQYFWNLTVPEDWTTDLFLNPVDI